MPDSDDAKYRLIEKLQKEVGRRLHSHPGVSGSAIGRAGAREDSEIGLVIFTKPDGGSIASDELSQIVEHAKSQDIAVYFEQRDLATAPLPTVVLEKPAGNVDEADRDDVFNPIIGGISCGPNVNIIQAPWAGTLGLVVKRRATGTTGLLSNCHVMFYDNKTSTVTQPARCDSVFNYPAGHDLAVQLGNVSLAGTDTYVDAAVASLNDDRTATRRKIFGVTNDVTGIRDRSKVRVGDRVSKSGLRTGVTTGVVRYTSVSGPDGSQPNQFAIEGDGGKPFADNGDSGSVVLSGTEVMGLLWGSNSDGGVKYGIVAPIEAVIQALDIEI